MANGKTSLDREGCEYGRNTRDQVERNREDIRETAQDIREIKALLEDLKETQDKNEFSNDITEKSIQWGVRAIIVGLISYLGYLIMHLTDFVESLFQ